MAVDVARLRVQISDVPRWYPAISDPAPDTLGIGDGTNVSFGLRFPNFVESSLTIYFGTVPASGPGAPSFTAQASSSYTLQNVNQVIFATAPTAGTIVAARYQATAFSDTDLQGYLAEAMKLQTTDRLILKQAHFDLIDVIIGDQERMILLKQGDHTRDPSKWAETYAKQKESMRKDLTGDPVPGKSVPAFSTGSTSYNRYGIDGGEVMR